MGYTQASPLLLLHGFPMGAAMWRHTKEHFRGERSVLAPEVADLVRGSLENPSMEAMAQAAVEFLDREAEGAKAAIAGLSMGGYIAMEIARAFLDRVAALVLCDTRCAADTEDARVNRDAMIQAVRERGVAEATASLVAKLLSPAAPESVRAEIESMAAQAKPEIIVALIRAMRGRRDYCEILGGFEGPAMVVRGADDALAPKDAAEQMMQRLPNGGYVEIPNAGHVPPLEAPEEFNRILEGFLTSHGL